MPSCQIGSMWRWPRARDSTASSSSFTSLASTTTGQYQELVAGATECWFHVMHICLCYANTFICAHASECSSIRQVWRCFELLQHTACVWCCQAVGMLGKDIELREDGSRQNRRLCWPLGPAGLAARPAHPGSPCSTGLSLRRSSSWPCRASFCLCRTRVSALRQWSAKLPSICWQCVGTRTVHWLR